MHYSTPQLYATVTLQLHYNYNGITTTIHYTTLQLQLQLPQATLH